MPIASALKSVAELAVGPFGSVGQPLHNYLFVRCLSFEEGAPDEPLPFYSAREEGS